MSYVVYDVIISSERYLGPMYTWRTFTGVKLRAGTTLSVKFSDYVYFTRYYDLFDFTLVC